MYNKIHECPWLFSLFGNAKLKAYARNVRIRTLAELCREKRKTKRRIGMYSHFARNPYMTCLRSKTNLRSLSTTVVYKFCLLFLAPRTHPVHAFERRKKLFILQNLRRLTSWRSWRRWRRRRAPGPTKGEWSSRRRWRRNVMSIKISIIIITIIFLKGLRSGRLYGWQHRGVRKKEEKKPLETRLNINNWGRRRGTEDDRSVHGLHRTQPDYWTLKHLENRFWTFGTTDNL